MRDAENLPMAGQPMFSVVTVTFRNLGGLRMTGQSVVEQSCCDFEWIVIDGGSDDGTVDYLSGLGDARLTFISEPDNGIFDAMRKGLELARGKFTVFMNAGDRFHNSAVLTDIADAVGALEPALIYGDSVEADGVENFYKPARAPRDNAVVMFTHHQAQLYLTKLAKSVGYDLSYKLSADWVLTTRILADSPDNVIYIAKPFCFFERGGVSQQKRYRALAERELFRIYREEQGHGRIGSSILWLRKVMINRARSRFPRIYDRLRYKKPYTRDERIPSL